MGATVAATGREEQPRAPSRGRFEIPQAKFLLFASWVIIMQGALIALFLPILVFSTTENIPPADIAMFGLMGVLSIVGGSLLYVAHRWTWWVALASTAVCGGYLVAVGGLTDQREGYLALGFSVAGVVLLVLGRAAAGRTEAIALASARVPFRLKVTAVWIAIFFIIGIFLVLSDLDTGFIRENLWYIAKGLEFTILLAAFAIVLAIVLALLGALARLSRNPVAYGVAGFYVSFFRGTPLIVQMFLLYLALPPVGRNLEPRATPGCRTASTGARPGGRDRRHHRPRPQLRRLHDRDLPRGHPVGGRRPGRGRRRAGHDVRPEDAQGRAAAGVPGDHPADRQRVHRDDEGHRAGLASSARRSPAPRSSAARSSSARPTSRTSRRYSSRPRMYWGLTVALHVLPGPAGDAGSARGYDRGATAARGAHAASRRRRWPRAAADGRDGQLPDEDEP